MTPHTAGIRHIRWAGVVLGLALGLCWVAVAFADDCSGASDCAGTTWFNNAVNTILPGLLAGLGLGGLTPFLNLLFPNLLNRPRVPAGPPVGTLNADNIRSRMNYLNNLAQRHNDPALAQLANRYRDRLIGPDGRVRVDEWNRFREEFGRITNERVAAGEKPNSWGWDAAASFVGAVGEFGSQVGGVIYNFGAGVVDVGGRVLGAGADAILHPIDTFNAAAQGLENLATRYGDWISSIPGVSEAMADYRDALQDGRYLDALSAFGNAYSTVLAEEGRLIAGGIKHLAVDMLAIEELQALFGRDTDLETRLWAFPAATIKIAGLVLGFESLATRSVPGLGPTSTLIPSVRAEAQMAVRLAEAVAQGGAVGETARIVQGLEGMSRGALAGQAAADARQLQQIISRNPELAGALDDALRAGSESNALHGLSQAGAMSRETEALLTARRMQLQEQAMANATRRILEEEARALASQGEKVPGTFQSFVATEGSRTTLGGANIKVDLDQTIKGLKNVSPERARQILAEECGNLGSVPGRGFTPGQLDANVYVPRNGLVDATGDKPFSDRTLRQILQQNTSSSSTYQVYVDRAGQVHVTGPFRGQGSQVLEIGEQVGGVRAALPAGTPRTSVPSNMLSDLQNLEHSVQKYYQAGDYAAMIKSANRASRFYGQYDDETRSLLRVLAGEKRPQELNSLLQSRGLTWQDLLNRLQPGA